MMSDDELEKCKCGQPAKCAHPCPYREEFNNDSDTLCNCCDKCRHECLMDI